MATRQTRFQKRAEEQTTLYDRAMQGKGRFAPESLSLTLPVDLSKQLRSYAARVGVEPEAFAAAALLYMVQSNQVYGFGLVYRFLRRVEGGESPTDIAELEVTRLPSMFDDDGNPTDDATKGHVVEPTTEE